MGTGEPWTIKAASLFFKARGGYKWCLNNLPEPLNMPLCQYEISDLYQAGVSIFDNFQTLSSISTAVICA